MLFTCSDCLGLVIVPDGTVLFFSTHLTRILDLSHPAFRHGSDTRCQVSIVKQLRRCEGEGWKQASCISTHNICNKAALPSLLAPAL